MNGCIKFGFEHAGSESRVSEVIFDDGAPWGTSLAVKESTSMARLAGKVSKLCIGNQRYINTICASSFIMEKDGKDSPPTERKCKRCHGGQALRIQYLLEGRYIALRFDSDNGHPKSMKIPNQSQLKLERRTDLLARIQSITLK